MAMESEMEKIFGILASVEVFVLTEEEECLPMIFPGFATWMSGDIKEGIIVVPEIFLKGDSVRIYEEGIIYLFKSSFHFNITTINPEVSGLRGFGYVILNVNEEWGARLAAQMHLDHFVYFRHDPEFETWLVGCGRFAGKRKLIFEFPE